MALEVSESEYKKANPPVARAMESRAVSVSWVMAIECKVTPESSTYCSQTKTVNIRIHQY